VPRPQEWVRCSAYVTSYATVGLSDAPILKDGRPIDVRTEFVGACATAIDDFDRCLATAAFCVINSGWFVAPGTVFPGIFEMHDASRTMKHCLFVPPFLWDDRIQTLQLETKAVAWLLAVPISEQELRLAETEGVVRLEQLLEKAQIDMFDLQRPSIV
jgi:hypothetical protein